MQDEIEEQNRRHRVAADAYEPANDDGADGAGRGRHSLFEVEVPDGDYTLQGKFGTRYV
jgi:hypothetical protein